jgi:hypothetical protein
VYSLGTWFVSGIYVYIPCTKEVKMMMMMMMMMMIIIIFLRVPTGEGPRTAVSKALV